MKLTNKTNLPEPIYQAILNDDYDSGDSDVTVTQLLAPPQQLYLKRKYADKIVEDASDHIWALVGKAIHYIIERSAGKDNLQECRFFAEVDEVKISGQVDDYNTETKTITDYKVTSVWKIVNGDFKEWEEQLNMYAVLARENGGEVENLRVIAILRDWSLYKAKENNYPSQQVVEIKIPLWEKDGANDFLSGLLTDYILQDDHHAVRRCSEEERWNSGDKWAVMKQGRKSAMRVLDTEEEAEAYLQEHLEVPDKGKSVKMWVEKRAGENKRCENYCPVKDFCPQYKELNNG